MKKLLVVLMAIALMISLSASSCDGEESDDGGGNLQSRFFELLFGKGGGKPDVADDSGYDDVIAKVELIEDVLAARNSATAADLTWTVVPGISFEASITFVGDKFFALGTEGELAYSTDGIDWKMIPRENTTFTNTPIYAIAWNGTTYVAVGSDANNSKMAYSNDGIRWTAIPSGTRAGTTTFGSSYIHGITWGGGKFIAFGSGARMAQSTDGINWTEINRGTIIGTPFRQGGSWVNNIAYGADRFVVTGYFNPAMAEVTYYIAYSDIR